MVVFRDNYAILSEYEIGFGLGSLNLLGFVFGNFVLQIKLSYQKDFLDPERQAKGSYTITFFVSC